MKVAVVLLNWRNSSDTLAAIESILCSESRSFQVVVCDNASGDGSDEAFMEWSRGQTQIAAQSFVSETSAPEVVAQAFANRIVWVATGGNLGFAGGNNVGLRLALKFGAFDYFWLLNNDCIVDRSSITALVRKMERDREVGICGAQVRYLEPAGVVQAYGGARHNRWTGCARYVGHGAAVTMPHSPADAERRLSYICGASMFVRKEVIETVGFMTEDYFLYFEELDWAMRAKGRFRLGYCADAIVYHKEGATIGSNSDTRRTSRVSDFYLFRNRLRFTARFYPYALPSVWLVMLLQAVKRGVRGQHDRMWLILSILFGIGAL